MKKLLTVILIMGILLMSVGCGQKEEKITEVKVDSSTTKNETSKETGEKDSQKEKVKIVFWDENAGPNRTPFYEHIIEKFHEENPDIEVEYVGIPWKSAKEKYDVAIASGRTPDVAGVPEQWIANFVTRGALLPLDEYFEAWEDKNAFIENYINFNRQLASDSKLYQLPRSANTGTLWYRSDVFEEKGLAPFDNWDDFFSGVEKLTDDNMYGFSIRGGGGSANQLIAYLIAYTGTENFFDKNGKVFLRDELAVEALEKFVSMYNVNTPESDITNGYKEMVSTFDTGKAAIIQHNLGSYGEHNKTLGKGKFSAMPFPKAANGNRSVAFGGANGSAIFANTEHPEEAWRFVAFLNNKYSMSYWNENVGQLPTRRDVNDEPWMEEQIHIGVMADALSRDDVVTVRTAGYLPGYSTVLKEIGEPGLQSVLLGETKASDLINDLADAFEKENAEYIKNN